MELYNFFTEMVEGEDTIEELKEMYEQLKPICHFVELVKWEGRFEKISKVRYSIIGQMYGADTNVGDTDLLAIISPIKYTWFDAFCPTINNIPTLKENHNQNNDVDRSQV